MERNILDGKVLISVLRPCSALTSLIYQTVLPFHSVGLLFVFSPFPITVQPEVFISRSESNSQYKPLTLSCLVTGFYPVDIEVTWLRNGEVMSETLSSGVRPNHDGTHQIQKEIEINAGDEDQYSCQIEHSSLAEPKLHQWGKELYWICTCVCMHIREHIPILPIPCLPPANQFSPHCKDSLQFQTL